MNELLNGKKHGPWSEEHDGRRAEGEYRHGQKVGVWKNFLPTGELAVEISYDEDGRRHGPEIWYYPSGQKQYEVSSDKGRKTGAETWWYEDGAVHKRGTYLRGKLNGKYEVLAPDGELISVTHYLRGKEVDPEANRVSPEVARAMAVVADVLDVLVERELLELDESYGREALEETMLNQLLRATRPDVLIDKWIKLLGKAGEVEELYGTDEELQAVMAEVLGLPA